MALSALFLAAVPFVAQSPQGWDAWPIPRPSSGRGL